jgi:hypothetical protein
MRKGILAGQWASCLTAGKVANDMKNRLDSLSLQLVTDF